MELDAKLSEAGGPPRGSLSPTENDIPGGNEDDEAELMPLKVAKSVSLPIARQPHQGVRLSPTESSIQLIKSLMALLLEQDASKQNTESHK